MDPRLGIKVNHDLLPAALMNLLHNAFKFTHRHTESTCHATLWTELVGVAKPARTVKDFGFIPGLVCHLPFAACPGKSHPGGRQYARVSYSYPSVTA